MKKAEDNFWGKIRRRRKVGRAEACLHAKDFSFASEGKRERISGLLKSSSQWQKPTDQAYKGWTQDQPIQPMGRLELAHDFHCARQTRMGSTNKH